MTDSAKLAAKHEAQALMDEQLKVVKLAREHDLYRLGYRFSFTFQGERHYAKSRDRARKVFLSVRKNRVEALLK